MNVEDFFLSRAAEKSETKEGDKALFVPNKRIQKEQECTGCRVRDLKFDTEITSKCHELRREKDKKGKINHAASSTTETFTNLAATNEPTKPITSNWLCDS